MKITRNICFLIGALGMLAGCAVTPKKLDSQQENADQYFVRKVETSNLERDQFDLLDNQLISLGNIESLGAKRFSRGDLIKIVIPSMSDYNGVYQINSAGWLELPFNESVKASGLTKKELTESVAFLLVAKGWFQEADFLMNISLVRESAIEVSVFGAVFNQGRVTINGRPADKPQDAIIQETGSFSNERDLTAAIRAAGGLRPDAQISNIVIKRDGNLFNFDLAAIVSGDQFPFIPSLVQGDQIYVASNGVEDVSLIRPSQLTPPGMRILMSNLTAPTLSNALSAVGSDSTRLPYGSSLLDAAVSANCVGGTHQANASRTILLITKHYGAKQQIVIKRTINQLLAASSDYSVNPYMMPNDGIACYDSRFTNLRDVARGIGELFGPIILGGIL